MKPEFLSSNERSAILKRLEIFGIRKIPYLLLKLGRDRIRAYSGLLSKEEILNLSNMIFIGPVGIYFAKYDGNDLKLSVDAVHLLKDQITDNILELEEKQVEEYLKGHDVEINEVQKSIVNEKRDYFVLKYKDDFLGMAKVSQGMLKNHLPKERRRKN